MGQIKIYNNRLRLSIIRLNGPIVVNTRQVLCYLHAFARLKLYGKLSDVGYLRY